MVATLLAEREGVCVMTIALRIDEPAPLGEVTLAPRPLTGRSEAELARAMAEQLLSSESLSDAEALARLRQSFPQAPLTVRVAALAAIVGRIRR